MPQKKGRKPAAKSENTSTAPAVPDNLLEEVDTEVAAKTPAAIVKAVRAKAKKIKGGKTEQQQPVTLNEAATETQVKSTNLDNKATDQAVNEIAVDEADTILALQDVANDTADEERLHRRKMIIDGTVLLVLVAILVAVILARHQLLDLYQSTKQ